MDATFDQLIQVLKDCASREQKINKIKMAFRDALAAVKTNEDARKLLEQLTKVLSMEDDQAKSLDQALSLADALSHAQPPPPPPNILKTGDVATQFRTLMDAIQGDARAPRDADFASTLKSLDIELKGLVVVKDNEAQIVPPTPGSTIDPGTLSTIRLSFGTIPVLKQAQAAASTPTTPPTRPAPMPGNPPPTTPSTSEESPATVRPRRLGSKKSGDRNEQPESE